MRRPARRAGGRARRPCQRRAVPRTAMWDFGRTRARTAKPAAPWAQTTTADAALADEERQHAGRGRRSEDDRERQVRPPGHVAVVDRADGFERVRLVGALVGPVPKDAREPQRHAARVARAALDAVEGDLDHELRPDVHAVRRAARLQLEQALGLPLEHRVGQPLEGLPEHAEAAVRLRGRRGAGSRASPRRRPWPHSAASTTRSSVCARLHLEPRAAAAAGRVRLGQRLHHHALVPARERVLEEGGGAGAGVHDRARHAHRLGDERLEHGEALVGRAVEEIGAVSVEDVEEERGERHRRVRCASTSRRLANRLAVTWNGCGRPPSRSAIASPSRTAGLDAEAEAPPRPPRAPGRSRRRGCA